MPVSVNPITVTSNTTPATRWLHLDWLRIIAFALLVPYHVGMVFVSWPYHFKHLPAVMALEPWLRLTSPWRMDLLFVVSGAATAFMLRRAGAATAPLLRQRLRRLLWPLAVGILLVVPPQSWLEVRQRFGYGGDYGQFMGLYLTGYRGFCEVATATGTHCLILPTWNHLWYLPYLASYTALLWWALRAWPVALDLGAAAVTRWLGRRGCGQAAGALRLLLPPVALLLVIRLTLGLRFPPSHALVDDWMQHAQYLLMFGFGALLAHTPALRPVLIAQRWAALVLAGLAWALLVWALPSDAAWRPERALAYTVQQWCAIVAALGFADRHLQREGRWWMRWRRWLSDAVFPLYILHQTLIVVGARLLAPLHWPWPIQAAVLVLATLSLGLGSAWLLARVRWQPLRIAFGLKPA